MKRVIMAIAVLLTLSASAQKQQDTSKQQMPPMFMLIGSKSDFDFLKQTLAEGKLIVNGVPLSYLQVNDLLKWLGSAILVEDPKKKQEPKKQ